LPREASGEKTGISANVSDSNSRCLYESGATAVGVSRFWKKGSSTIETMESRLGVGGRAASEAVREGKL
jgi:hypothetical protein